MRTDFTKEEREKISDAYDNVVNILGPAESDKVLVSFVIFASILKAFIKQNGEETFDLMVADLKQQIKMQ